MNGKDERDLLSPEGSPSTPPLSPLDPAERLPREEVLARGRGGGQLQRRPGSAWRKLTRPELTAVVGFPAVVVLGIVLGASGAPAPVVVVSIAILVLALAGLAFTGRRRRRGS
ncbi:MAG TPA: hypothetical protein VJN67_23635 [Stellaceae bacterium]|nr:hypothetical protein [Stellaceae bacterium]